MSIETTLAIGAEDPPDEDPDDEDEEEDPDEPSKAKNLLYCFKSRY